MPGTVPMKGEAHWTLPQPRRHDRRSERTEHVGEGARRVLVDEGEQQHPVVDRLVPGDVAGGVGQQRERTEPEHGGHRGAGQRTGQVGVPHPGAELGAGRAGRRLEVDGHQAGEPVVEGELGGHAVLVAGARPLEAVEARVDVVTVLEHSAGGVEHVHLVHGPAVPLVVVAVEHVVDAEVAPHLRVGHEGGPADRVAPGLQRGRGHEPGAGEVVGTDLAAGVEVVPLVPPVVGHLVAAVGLDQRVQDRADPDRVVGDPTAGGGGIAGHGARSVRLRGGMRGSAGQVGQGPLVYLHHRGQGELVEDHHPVRRLVVGQRGPGGVAQGGQQHVRIRGGLVARLRDHEGHADLPEHRIGCADHGHLVDTGVVAERPLDLGGVDVVAAPDVELVGPSDEVEPAVPVEVPEVAGGEPPLGVQHRVGGLPVEHQAGRSRARRRTAPVAPHDGGRPEAHTAHLAVGHRRPRRRTPPARPRGRAAPPRWRPPRRDRRGPCRSRGTPRSRCTARRPGRRAPPAWPPPVRPAPVRHRCRRSAGSTGRRRRARDGPAPGPTGSAPPGRR